MSIMLFIYGSLLPGLENHHYIGNRTISARPGYVSGRLVDCGPYPALVRDGRAAQETMRVAGLWIEIDRKTLLALDQLEEFAGLEESNDYERIWTSDLEQAGCSGWVYVWPTDRGLPEIAGDSWPAYLAERDGGYA
ncbi:gamma-glutamylcyclotransferase (GGCT)/AIG2-like uncharacterized protein YtfP [Paenibacillus phyllosphaerae]|uniref:Gamma-glutamylcyclotransferase (GGCT)/AIG2-like uncharacterized protein YtfP n=1 Tax=Paenibacillus phyllosphaerae TaxID=274593 RepID=A0A7W5FRC2_9BACL|nr:gamma-glutamylcyclotransferase family protein [Paenibacillus phyllosphaerae]MBB3114371.1 gamma-glutamylcyclotransferase (GGCT)/AIG2-like uncharacterized protein YtfP [Paenibacillus phyllosphaerae]